MSRKKWVVSEIDKALACNIADEFEIDPFAALLLVSRGITDYDEIADFFNEEGELSDPFTLKDMDKAAERIELALDRDE